MCLLFVLFGERQPLKCANLAKALPPFVIVSVRDEDFHRGTSRGRVNEAGRYAPQDLKAGGTWMSYNHSTQRFAVILNNHHCDVEEESSDELISRGTLPTMFTDSTITVSSFLKNIEERGSHFNGFNLIFGDSDGVHYVSNRDERGPVRLQPNILHGWSNGSLNDESALWPRVDMGKSVIEAQLKDMTLTFPETENACRHKIKLLIQAFQTNEYVNPDASMRGTCHERLILPPQGDHSNILYGTRTVTALATFERRGNDHQSAPLGSDGNAESESRVGVYIEESDFDPESLKWSVEEHVLL